MWVWRVSCALVCCWVAGSLICAQAYRVSMVLRAEAVILGMVRPLPCCRAVMLRDLVQRWLRNVLRLVVSRGVRWCGVVWYVVALRGGAVWALAIASCCVV